MSVGDHIIIILLQSSLMMKGDHGQINQLHDINWGEFDHASRAPQLMSCNYSVCMHAYVCVCMCVCVHTRVMVCVHMHVNII